MEELQSANRKLTPEEEKKMKEGAIVVVEGQKRIIKDITHCKKLKTSFEYECNFKGCAHFPRFLIDVTWSVLVSFSESSGVMAGFQLRQAFWIVLILAQQLPKSLLRVGVAAVPPASNPIDRALSGGSNAIADLEPTRHENLAPAQLLATHEHCDESPDAETQIEQDLTTENRPSPSGQELSASHSRG